MPKAHIQKHEKIYICTNCHKLTRDTGQGESGTGLCYPCLQIAELDNSLSDEDITQEEYDIAVAKIKAAPLPPEPEEETTKVIFKI